MQIVTVKSLKELAGKTIKTAAKGNYGSDISLLFEDGSVVTFEVERGYDPGDETVEVDTDDATPVTLFHLGVITEAEMKAIYAREDEARQTRLAQYEELRKEFETAPPPASS